jgi:uncharacterized protein (DUF1501 family)
MLTLRSAKGVRFCDGLTRRDFLRVGTLAAGSVGLSVADLGRLQAGSRSSDINCILLLLVGGPSHLDTWDLKPGAPDTIRGPFRPIATNVPGIQIGEHFPRMARLADRYALVRSVHHTASPIHETGHQLMQTGHLSRAELEYPHYGAVVAHLRGPRPGNVPPFVLLPGPIGNTGVTVSHGQGAGYLGAAHEPLVLRAESAADGLRLADIATPPGTDPARLPSRHALLSAIDDAQRAYDAAERERPPDEASAHAYGQLFASPVRRAFDLASESQGLRDQYGRDTFGQSCLLARRLVEHGVRLVTLNMFDTVFNKTTWDCHADGGVLSTTLHEYATTLCPMFDRAYSALLEDLHQRGLLETTLVVAMGEFGRTPQLNPRGGRDHWPGVWSVLLAGGGIKGGQVIGSSDRIGAEPRDRPVTPGQLAATVYHALGFNRDTRLPGPDGRTLPLFEADPVSELFDG